MLFTSVFSPPVAWYALILNNYMYANFYVVRKDKTVNNFAAMFNEFDYGIGIISLLISVANSVSCFAEIT